MTARNLTIEQFKEGIDAGGYSIRVVHVPGYDRWDVLLDAQVLKRCVTQAEALFRACGLFQAVAEDDRPLCPSCGRHIGLTPAGLISVHKPPEGGARVCPGSRAPPAGGR